jgi:GxxExxY protein
MHLNTGMRKGWRACLRKPQCPLTSDSEGCKDITEKIIGAAFEVHKFLGNGFQEVIYQRALPWELSQSGLSFDREIEQEIFYKELSEPIGTRRADFVVQGKVLVELKAIIDLEDVHLAQVLNYLKAYRLQVDY